MKNLIPVILAVIIIFNQVAILGPILQRGLMHEDWNILLGYKVEQERHPFFPERIKHIWETQDKLYKNQIIYIGIFNDLFGLNRTAYILVNIVLKIAATLSIYLLLVTLFKNRFLAFLTSFFFSISPSVAGSLVYIVTGDDYLSLIFMSFFAISYFYLLKKGGSRLPSSILLTLAIVSSPLRIHPFLLFPIAVESFLVLKNKTLQAMKVSAKRIIIFLLPVYLL